MVAFSLSFYGSHPHMGTHTHRTSFVFLCPQRPSNRVKFFNDLLRKQTRVIISHLFFPHACFSFFRVVKLLLCFGVGMSNEHCVKCFVSKS